MPFKKGNKTVWSKESIEKRRVTVLKRYPDGLKPSKETRKKQSKAHLGLKPSKETIEKRKMTIAKRYPDGLKPSKESIEKGIRTKAKKPKKICSVAGCKKTQEARGYCGTHYSYERKEHGFGVSANCKILNCKSPVTAKGYCSKHYQLRRLNDPFPDQKRCKVPNCNRGHYGKGYCHKHYDVERHEHGFGLAANCKFLNCEKPATGGNGYCSPHYRAVYHEEEKTKLFNLLGGKKCRKCGYDKDVRALSFDHKDNDGNKHRRKKGYSDQTRYVYWLKNPELAKKKLQVLCMNCNQIKRYISGDLKKNYLGLITRKSRR